MRKELEDILSKTVEEMTPEDAHFYDIVLNRNKHIIKGCIIFMGIATALGLAAGLGLGFLLDVKLGIIMGILLELSGAYFSLHYLLAEIDNKIENNSFCFEKGEKKEFKKAKGFEKMKQLLKEYEKLHGKDYKNIETLTYEEYIKEIEKSLTPEQENKTQTETKKVNLNSKKSVENEETNNKTL